jgi:hypothetical protein
MSRDIVAELKQLHEVNPSVGVVYNGKTAEEWYTLYCQASATKPKINYCEEYAENVKAAVGKLIDLTYQGKFHTLEFDTDEDCPYVHAWYKGKSYKVYGSPDYGLNAMSPPEDENWCFLECCQRVIAEIEKSAAPMAESRKETE